MASHIALSLPQPLPLPLTLKRPKNQIESEHSGIQQQYEIFQSEKDTLAYLIRLEICDKYRICSEKYFDYYCNYYIHSGPKALSGAGRLFKQFQKDVHSFQMIIKTMCEFPSPRYSLHSIPLASLFVGITPPKETIKHEFFGMKQM